MNNSVIYSSFRNQLYLHILETSFPEDISELTYFSLPLDKFGKTEEVIVYMTDESLYWNCNVPSNYIHRIFEELW